MSNPTDESIRIRRGGAADAARVIDALDRALGDDPFVRWLARPGPDHARARRSYLKLMVERIAVPRGEMWVSEEDGETIGAALWAPPHTFELSAGETLRLLPLMLDVVGFSRMTRVTRALDHIDAARPPEPRWLLTLVGTTPEHRGRGVGTALLDPALAICDAEGLPAVLETANPGNLAFYERLGFRERARRPAIAEIPESWTLVRDPRA